MASSKASWVLVAASRRRCFVLAKNCSIGLRSDEQGGRKIMCAPTLRIAARAAFPWWLPRLSRIVCYHMV